MKRNEQQAGDTWDLSPLFENNEAFYAALENFKTTYLAKAGTIKGTLCSKKGILDGYDFIRRSSLLLERLAQYAQLKNSADSSDMENQKMLSYLMMTASSYMQQLAFFDTEILSNDEKDLEAYIADKDFKDLKRTLTDLLRQKKHILDEEGERLLAGQMEVGSKASKIFQDLTTNDFNFGTIDGKPLSESTFSLFLKDSDEGLRKQAYNQLYSEYENHKYTLANTYEMQIKQDIFVSKARGYASTRAMKLYDDNVDESVYDNLIAQIHEGFPVLHDYYALRAKLMGKDRLHHWDVYTPLVEGFERHTTYDEAVAIVEKALSPLGKEYTDTLKNGLTAARWVDKYENEGKRHGAFSSGTYESYPYILLNYKEDDMRDIFTIAHEGGHSMHSWYATHNNTFFDYDYTIFEAEVASTFNEQLLAGYLLDNSTNKAEKAYLLGKQLDDLIATLFRQTMFAEFEHQAHCIAEEGNPLTVDVLRDVYRKLLEAYFGPMMEFSNLSDMEGLRIPHFYSSYYVYKYATGVSAAIALSKKVLGGGQDDLEHYKAFLKSGGSRYPLDSLRLAGVDMSKKEPVQAAIAHFAQLLKQFTALI